MTPPLDILVQDFFCRRLIEQQGASRRTIEAYRDAFRLLLAYLPVRLKKPVPSLELSDLDAPAILAFLDHLETERQNGPRTRNARLAAVRSFVQYAASRDPTAWPLARRVLAIPSKRYTKPIAWLPDPRRDAGRAQRPRRSDLGRSSRPGLVRRDVQHRGACVRDHRAASRRSDRRRGEVVAHPG